MKKLVFLVLCGYVGLFAFDFNNGSNLFQNDDRDEDRYKYRGYSGHKYQYDLNDPVDRQEYRNDPFAQMQDSINPDPEVQLDRAMGQFGGGTKW